MEESYILSMPAGIYGVHTCIYCLNFMMRCVSEMVLAHRVKRDLIEPQLSPPPPSQPEPPVVVRAKVVKGELSDIEGLGFKLEERQKNILELKKTLRLKVGFNLNGVQCPPILKCRKLELACMRKCRKLELACTRTCGKESVHVIGVLSEAAEYPINWYRPL